MEKKSKIEKLVIYYDEILGKDRDVRILDMANKIDEIIDHLNSQDQEEETRGLVEVGECDCDACMRKKEKQQDTQEGWKEVNKDIWYMVGGKKYVNINGEEYVRTSDIEKLLSKLTTK